MILRPHPLLFIVLFAALTATESPLKNRPLTDKQQAQNKKEKKENSSAKYNEEFASRLTTTTTNNTVIKLSSITIERALAAPAVAEPMLKVSRNGAIENNLSAVIGEARKSSAAASGSPVEATGGAEPREEDVIEAADFGLQAMHNLYYVKEPQLYKKGLYLSPNNPARFVAAFNDQTEEAKQLAKYGYAALEAAAKFRSKFPDILRQTSTRRTDKSPLRQQCPRKGIPQCPSASLRYRTTDGSCNNLRELWWGSAMSPMQRFLPAFYHDGIQTVRKSVTGNDLPSARSISGRIHEERDASLTSVTHMLMQWGQFVDHDITATGQSKAFNGSVPQCCLPGSKGFQPPEFLHPECLPIAVPPEDRRLGPLGVRCIEFVRSGPVPREDCEFGSREQLSQVTSFIDASTVYSSSARQGDSLRIFRAGLMRYGKLQSRRPLLPREDESDLCRRGSLSTSCFKAGDVRLSEQPALISLHIVFLRLHNRLATQIAALNQHWGDEKIFQETRKIVGALIQHITYREFLPIVLGHEVMKLFDIELLRKGYYEGYDETVNPNVANEFASAAFRFGHSLVQPSFVRFDRNHQPIFNNVSIHEEFMNPVNLETAGSVDRILLGLINQPAQKRDEFISGELTGHLFQAPGFPFGMDLASLNIQRGRDHGIPPFVEWREPCGLTPVRNWSDFERLVSPETVRKFRDLYDAVEDVDLFSAGLAEKSVIGGLVGPTFACIIAQQFRNLRKGDRFWYENPFLENGFTPGQLQQIRRVTLAQILCRTMDGIDNIQPFVMLAADNLRNSRLPCTDSVLTPIDLQPWIERPRRRSIDKPDSEEKNNDNVGDGEKEIEAENSESDSSEARAAPTKRRPNQRTPQRPGKPSKTKINQHNRITVKRPLGPHENLTIVVNNNAVSAPVFVSDSIYGSNVLINQFPGLQSQKPTQTNDQVPAYDNQQSQSPYYPHNYQDPNNPNPPNYGLSPKPTNNYFSSNEFFAYTTATNYESPPLPPQGSTDNTQNQQYSYFTTKRPQTQWPPAQGFAEQNQQNSGYFTTRKPQFRPTTTTAKTTTRQSYSDYEQDNNYQPNQSDGTNNYRPLSVSGYSSQGDTQDPYANFEPNSSDRDEHNLNQGYGTRPSTKRPPKQPYQSMSNRRYPEPRPQQLQHQQITTSQKERKTKPTSKRPIGAFSSHNTRPAEDKSPANYNFHSGSVTNDEPQKGNNPRPFLHTHTTISDVQYVTLNKQPHRQEVNIELELPKPIPHNRESEDAGIVQLTAVEGESQPKLNGALDSEGESTVRIDYLKTVDTETNSRVIKEEQKLTTIVSIVDNDDLAQNTKISVFQLKVGDNKIIDDAPKRPQIDTLEEDWGNDTSRANSNYYELPRPIKIKHEI